MQRVYVVIVEGEGRREPVPYLFKTRDEAVDFVLKKADEYEDTSLDEWEGMDSFYNVEINIDTSRFYGGDDDIIGCTVYAGVGADKELELRCRIHEEKF